MGSFEAVRSGRVVSGLSCWFAAPRGSRKATALIVGFRPSGFTGCPLLDGLVTGESPAPARPRTLVLMLMLGALLIPRDRAITARNGAGERRRLERCPPRSGPSPGRESHAREPLWSSRCVVGRRPLRDRSDQPAPSVDMALRCSCHAMNVRRAAAWAEPLSAINAGGPIRRSRRRLRPSRTGCGLDRSCRSSVHGRAEDRTVCRRSRTPERLVPGTTSDHDCCP